MNVELGPKLYGGLAAEFVVVAGRLATVELTVHSFSTVLYLAMFGYALAIAGMMIVAFSRMGGLRGAASPI